MAEAEEKKVEEKKEEVAPAVTPEVAPAAEAKPATTTATGEKKKVNWVLTLVLSILVGQLGVDRFMMGQIGLGVVKLITAGGCGIWWIVDIILIATKHDMGVEWVE